MIYQITMSVMSKALSNPRARDRAVKVLNRWAEAETRSLRYAVAWNLQQRLSEATGYPICGYCQWVEFPDDLHSECREQLGIPMSEDEEYSGESLRMMRVVEHRYDNYIVHEDGDPLGLSDVASHGPYKTTVWNGLARPEDFDNHDFLGGEGIEFQEDSWDGFTEFAYRLEELIGGKWEFVKYLSRPQVVVQDN